MKKKDRGDVILAGVFTLGIFLAVAIAMTGCLEDGNTEPGVEGVWYTKTGPDHCYVIMNLDHGDYYTYRVCRGQVSEYRYGTYEKDHSLLHINDQGGPFDMRYVIGAFGEDLKVYYDGAGDDGQDFLRCTKYGDCLDVIVIANQHP